LSPRMIDKVPDASWARGHRATRAMIVGGVSRLDSSQAD
jgi:hypothetical protein